MLQAAAGVHHKVLIRLGNPFFLVLYQISKGAKSKRPDEYKRHSNSCTSNNLVLLVVFFFFATQPSIHLEQSKSKNSSRCSPKLCTKEIDPINVHTTRKQALLVTTQKSEEEWDNTYSHGSCSKPLASIQVTTQCSNEKRYHICIMHSSMAGGITTRFQAARRSLFPISQKLGNCSSSVYVYVYFF